MIVYLSFLLISLIWLAFLFLGPYLLTFGGKYSNLAEIYYLLFGIICHQNPERSYFVWGHQMPVCVRCFGIYAGILLGLLIYPLLKKTDNTVMPKIKYLILFCLPILFDGISQILRLYPSPHYIRLITGILASAAGVFYILSILNQLYISFTNIKANKT